MAQSNCSYIISELLYFMPVLERRIDSLNGRTTGGLWTSVYGLWWTSVSQKANRAWVEYENKTIESVYIFIKRTI